MCTASNIQKNIYEYRISLSFFFDIYMKIKFIMRNIQIQFQWMGKRHLANEISFMNNDKV